jgi:hypothetical protein
MNIILNSNTCDGLLNPKESKRVAPCPKVGCWISAVRPSGGKPEAARMHPGLQRGLRITDYIYQHFKHWNFYNGFYPAVFKPILVIFFNFGTCNFTIRTNNKNEIFTGINFSQLIIAKKTKIKDLGRAPPDLFLSLQKVPYKLNKREKI